jgi:hypothetical protein
MLMLPIANDSANVNDHLPEPSFTQDERRRLSRVKATVYAERKLVPLNQPCTDHQTCRRLAFELWLFAAGSLSEGTER